MTDSARYTASIVDRQEEGGVSYYIIDTTDGSRHWRQKRRYKEFASLYSRVSHRVPLPPMPEKSTFRRHLFSSFLEERQAGLNNMLQSMLRADPELQNLDALRDFLGTQQTTGYQHVMGANPVAQTQPAHAQVMQGQPIAYGHPPQPVAAQPVDAQPAQPASAQPAQALVAQPAYAQPVQHAQTPVAYAQPAQTAYAQPAYPAYAQPVCAHSPQLAGAQCAQPAYAQPVYAQPSHLAYAQPAYAQPLYAQPPFSQLHGGDQDQNSMNGSGVAAAVGIGLVGGLLGGMMLENALENRHHHGHHRRHSMMLENSFGHRHRHGHLHRHGMILETHGHLHGHHHRHHRF